ncbi:MAG: RNase P subunit p30 family protein [Halanaeroarchaeum sp.]
MYEAVRVESEGRSTAARFAATAADAGFDGVVLAMRPDDGIQLDVEKIEDAYHLDVVEGVEIVSDDRGAIRSTVSSVRSETTVLAGRGGTPEMNRFVAETAGIDVLRAPLAGEGDVNHVVVKAARRNDVRIEVNLGRVLRASGGRRVQSLRKLRKLRELLDHYDAPFVVSGDPGTHLEVRGPRELVAVGEQIGLGGERVRAGLEEWGVIAAANREKRSSSYVADGVRRGRHEE